VIVLCIHEVCTTLHTTHYTQRTAPHTTHYTLHTTHHAPYYTIHITHHTLHKLYALILAQVEVMANNHQTICTQLTRKCKAYNKLQMSNLLTSV
jgi:hypothetical protein